MSFLTRFFDIAAQTYTLHSIIHEVHGPELSKNEYIFLPGDMPGHWASLWIDTTRRTMKYLDSYFEGGAIYANAIQAYLEDFEATIGQKQ